MKFFNQIALAALAVSCLLMCPSAYSDDLADLKKIVAQQQAEIQKLKNSTSAGQITLLNSNGADGERIAIPHPDKPGWVRFLASSNQSVMVGEDRTFYREESLPGPGWAQCTCSLALFEAGTCGGAAGRRNLGRGRGDGSGTSYGELRGFTCSYDRATGGIVAGVWWGNQTGCNSLAVSWSCRR